MRRFIAGLCASLLAASLLGLGMSWSAWHVLSQPDYIKDALRASGVYQTFTDDLIKQKAADTAASDKLPADQPEVQTLIKQALSPELLQTQTEQAIDNSFAFLQGKAATLDTGINLEGARQKLADSMATYAKERAQSLPTCTAATMPASPVDILHATCVPPGFDANMAAAEARDNVLGDDLLKDTRLDASEVKTGSGNTLQNQLHNGPTWYDRIMWSVYIQAILAVVMAGSLVLLSATRRTGMRRVGVIAVWTGAVNAAAAWLSGLALQFISQKVVQTSFGGLPIQQKVFTIVRGVFDDIQVWWLWYSAVIFAAGAILLLIYRFSGTTPGKQAVSHNTEEHLRTSPQTQDMSATTQPVQPPTLVASEPTAIRKKIRPRRRIQ